MDKYIQLFDNENQVIISKNLKSLEQYFDPYDEYQVHTIPVIKDMIAKFK